MNKIIVSIFIILILSACVATPATDKKHKNKCEILSEKKTLKVMEIKRTKSNYISLEAWVLTPILFPITAIVSGTFVLINNTYNLIEEKVMCNDD